MACDFLPLQIIYQGITDGCHPHSQFPLDWGITISQNHWSREDTTVLYIKNRVYSPTKKCIFGMKQCVHLGYVVGGGLVHPKNLTRSRLYKDSLSPTQRRKCMSSSYCRDTTADSSQPMLPKLYQFVIRPNQHRPKYIGQKNVTNHLIDLGPIMQFSSVQES